MSGLEVAAVGVGVVAAIGAVIAGIEDGQNLWRRWKAKRKEKRLRSQEERYDRELESARRRIEDEYSHRFRQLGARFARGDGEFSFDHRSFVLGRF